jgi:3-oxoacyl-[acyl-carrier-protein] synthase-3
LQRAGWAPEDLDLIIFATLSPDIFFPGSGCIMQHKLGLDSTPALDIRQQCTGFLYGITTADAYIRSNLAKRILLVGAEVHSTGLNISTAGRDVAVIFGDGAGAVCLEGIESNDPVGVLGSALHADGKFSHSLMVEAGSSRLNPRISHELIDEGRHWPVMDGKAIFKLAVQKLPQVVNEVLENAGLALEDVDLFIPHQANLRINQFFAQSMKLPQEKVFNNIQRYGNTTAASIPIAFDEALEMKIIDENSTVMFLGLGAGLTWGAVVARLVA